MKKTFIIASVMMAIVFAGCTKDDFEQDNNISTENNTPTDSEESAEGDRITLTASAVTKDSEAAAGMRIAYGATDATWETGDKIFLVKSDGTTITLTLSAGAGTSTGSFTSTDPIVAGTYTPYAVSASSITKGFVSISDGVITLDLSAAGGGTLADAIEHDILKGDAIVLEDDQESATITGLTTHMLSYLRFKFTATEKAISTIGMSSTGGVYRTVTIAADGTVSGSNSSTDVVSVSAGDDGANNYSGYFAVYGSTTTSLLAHAEDEDEGKYTRLVSVNDANYTAGTVYGKSFTLSNAMMTAAATGQLSSQNWKNLGLSVKWAEFYVNTSAEYAYDRSFDTNGNTDPPASWTGWRHPTREEVNELYYASTLEWVSTDPNGMKFTCNDNYITMGASGYHYDWEIDDRDSEVGESIYFFIDEVEGSNRLWTKITNTGFSIYNANSRCTNVRCYTYYGAMRLVCDY